MIPHPHVVYESSAPAAKNNSNTNQTLCQEKNGGHLRCLQLFDGNNRKNPVENKKLSIRSLTGSFFDLAASQKTGKFFVTGKPLLFF